LRTIADVFKNITLEPIVAHPNEEILSIHEKITTQRKRFIRCVYVLNAEKQVIGMITLKEIMKYIAVRKALPVRKRFSAASLFIYISKDLKAEMIMRPPLTIKENETLENALKYLIDNNAEEAAVVTEDGIILGDLNVYELLKHMQL